jgi:predicted nucleotidyltransferase
MDYDKTREVLAERLTGLLSDRREIQEAYLFGSCARSMAREHSDIDIAVFVDEERLAPSGFGYRATLTTELMKGLGTNQVDVVLLNQAPPLLYHRVLRDGIRLLSRDLRATTAREGRALSRYCDYAPQLAKIEAALIVAREPEATS